MENKIFIPGPAGRLEASISGFSDGSLKKNIGVVCHPHPLYQGTMDNKVVTSITGVWQELGLSTIRFNFRGVGESTGSYGELVGEVEDLRAILHWIDQREHDPIVWLGGFSFGALVAIKVGSEYNRLAGLVSVAPAFRLFDLSNTKVPSCPWLIVSGDEDELIPLEQLKQWYQSFTLRTGDLNSQLVVLPNTTHFFHGKLPELKGEIRQFMVPYL